jgi:glutathione S-transferase
MASRVRVVRMPTLYDAARCPYCARVRIVLAEKDLEYETVAIDLSDRPAWIYEKNPSGKVPVWEEDGFVLPESAVIMEYLEELRPQPPLLPPDAAGRALARVWVDRFDDRLGDSYYALRRGEAGAGAALEDRLRNLDRALSERPFLTGPDFGLADVAYLPWVLRARSTLGVDLAPFPALVVWVERLAERPSVAREVELVEALVR